MIEFPDFFPEEEISQGISFAEEDVDFSLSNESVAETWLLAVIQEEGQIPGPVSIIFCSDDYLYNLNVQYLNHDTLTDVITFPYSEHPVSGDIFISIDRVQDNALSMKIPFLHELHRVMVHGVLHLMGYLDDSPEKKDQMRQKEDFYLSRLPGF